MKEMTKKILLKFNIWPVGLLHKIIGRDEFNEVDLLFKYISNKNSSGSVMLDVGAAYGDASYKFARNGWKVFAFEMDESKDKWIYLKWLEKRYDFHAIRAGVSNKNLDEASYFRSKKSSGISSLGSFDESHIESGICKLIRLDSFIEKNKIEKIDILKIDAEGFDYKVLESLGEDWLKTRPKYIIAEFDNKKDIELKQNTLKNIKEWAKRNKYKYITFEWSNDHDYGGKSNYIKAHYQDETSVKVSAWGNIMLFESEFELLEFKEKMKDYI